MSKKLKELSKKLKEFKQVYECFLNHPEIWRYNTKHMISKLEDKDFIHLRHVKRVDCLKILYNWSIQSEMWHFEAIFKYGIKVYFSCERENPLLGGYYYTSINILTPDTFSAQHPVECDISTVPRYRWHSPHFSELRFKII